MAARLGQAAVVGILMPSSNSPPAFRNIDWAAL